ncbi:MAG: hypothetical protein JJT78_14710 [Leptospira sp.]|nr:hypothetical protein [Leptospira sp.]
MQNIDSKTKIIDRLRSVANSEKIINKAIGILLICISSLTFVYFAFGSWDYFLSICPNTDMLTWDENIRLNIVYDQFSDFKNGRIGQGIIPFFEAPTWPPLRSIITFFLLFMPSSLLVSEWDSLVGLLFLVATFASLVYIGYRLTKNWLFTGIISLSGLAILLQTIEVSAYSLSSMLETQSMFFLLWCYYFFYRFYSEVDQLSRKTIMGISGFLLLFFFTKYPYGIMLFMALILLEVLRNFPECKEAFQFAFKEHYRGIRRILLILVVLFVFSIPFLRLFEGINFNQRSFKLGLYYLSLPVFLDFQYFLWKHRFHLREVVPKSLRVIYICSTLPALIWIYGNPDRVSSLLDAQMIVNHYTKSFFLSIVATRSDNPMLPMAVFDDPWGIRVLLLLTLASLIVFFYHSRQAITTALKDPLVSISFLLFLQILILETTTGNKQQRHILQYLPALALILWLWIFRGLHLRIPFWQYGIGMGFFMSILVLGGSHGIWAGNYFQDRYFCLRGEDATVFEPVRWVDKNLPRDKNILLFNGFHETYNYDKKGRLIASEFDLKIRQDRYRDYFIRHDNKHRWKTWERFDELAFISYSCEDPNLLKKLNMRKEAVGADLKSISKLKHPSGDYCLERYQIISK